MNYLKKPLGPADIDALRLALSVRQDARDISPGDPDFTRKARLSPEPLCDWCGEGEPVVAYHATHMSTGEKRPCWRWVACKRCERMIDRENWDALRRMIAMRTKRFFAAKFASMFPSGVPETVLDEAASRGLEDFLNYAVRVADTPAGGGKSQANTFTGEQS